MNKKKRIFNLFTAGLLSLAFLGGFAFARIDDTINLTSVRDALRVLGFDFPAHQIEMMMPSVRVHMQNASAIREAEVDNAVVPALMFNPVPAGKQLPVFDSHSKWEIPGDIRLPDNMDELAFYSIPELASLLRQRLITSTELTRYFLDRIDKYGDTLECVVTITRERAMEQARAADLEIETGYFRGPLHGIPYGAKDLLAVEGYRTSWGAVPYKDQVIGQTATVIRKLDEAGAVLLAKTTLGALAMGDIWFGGQTRNPWNLAQGSSGSSAGSASAVSAGLIPFAIGTETLGSIVSPSTRCGITGLRPTFGRVSRHGAMALSWSMDKIGPMARSAIECAMVLEVIDGVDGLDQTLIDVGFAYDVSQGIEGLRVGYIHRFFESEGRNREFDLQVLDDLRAMGVELLPVEWNFNLPINALRVILNAEAAAAFDHLTVSGLDSLLVNQAPNAWPNLFRSARIIPAVEYINANRIRQLLVEQVNELMAGYDVIVTPSFEGNQLLVTNLTGHPCLVAPHGLNDAGSPLSITFIGNLFEEHKLVMLAHAWQEYTGHHLKRPPFFDPL